MAKTKRWKWLYTVKEDNSMLVIETKISTRMLISKCLDCQYTTITISTHSLDIVIVLELAHTKIIYILSQKCEDKSKIIEDIKRRQNAEN